MGARHAIQKHRARQHWHALDRLRERYWFDAELDDVIALRDLAATAAVSVKALPWAETKQVYVEYRGQQVRVVYCPRYNAVRTVLL